MPPRKSISAAQHAERPTLAPTWLIMLLAGMVGGGLWLLYPRQDLERRLANAPGSALSVAYLNNLLSSEPNNPKLRLLLAQRQILQGDNLSARATLQPALDSSDPVLHRDALWALWHLSYAEWLQTPASDAAHRSAMREGLRKQLTALAQEPWPVERQLELARLATQLGQAALGIDLYRRIAASEPDPRKAALLYERAAKEAFAQSNYDSCAELYMLARKTTRNPQQAKAYYSLGVKALQSGNQPAAALDLAERELGPLSDDPEILYMLAKLARAAGQPMAAERFVRRLLQLSLPSSAQQAQATVAMPLLDRARPLRQLVAWRVPADIPRPSTQAVAYDDGAHYLQPPHLAASAAGTLPQTRGWRWRTVQGKKTAQALQPVLPYDEKIYTLAYEVFLESGHQEDAWQIARAAARQQPDSLIWHERLARVSDWTHRLAIALENWLYVARKTQRDDAWQSVLRIAPGQFDDSALIEALRYQLRQQPDDPRLVRELVAAYERIGDPQPAMDYLLQHSRSPQSLQLLAQLADRAGRPEVALATWRRLLSDPAQITPARAMEAAVLALTHNQPDEGLGWLEASRRQPPTEQEAPEYWRLLGQLAQKRHNDALAIDAYRTLAKNGSASIADYDAFIRLLQDQPLEAARLSEQAWLLFDEPRHFVQALTLYSNGSRWGDMKALLQRIDTQPGAERRAIAPLQRNPEFLRLVGLYYQNVGQAAKARSYFETGLQLSPESTALRQALIWLFIDGNDAVSLHALLASRELEWARDPELHDSLAAAYQALSLPQTALDRYLTPRVKSHEGDFLWFMNYADALDQNQQVDRAWRLRRRLLAQEWGNAPPGSHPGLAQARQRWLAEDGLEQTRRIARTRLILTQQPGDAGLDVLRELLRLDKDAQKGMSNAAMETAIGWLQDAGEYTAERGFLWHQYARSRSQRSNRPLWADITVALAEDDKAATGQLLEAFDERLPRYDRVNAARAVDDLRLAQTAAFEAQQHQPDDQPLHLQLEENLLAFSDHAGTQLTQQELGGMREAKAEAVLHLALTPRLSLDLDFASTRRRATREAVVYEPPQERGLEAVLRWRHPDGETLLRGGHRESFRSYTPLQVEHEQRIGDRLTLRMDMGMNLRSEESLALRIAGMKDRAGASLSYQATRQDQLVGMLWAERYRLQTGTEVGSGRHGSLSYTHSYRMEAPSLEFGAFWSAHDFSQRDLASLSPQDQEFRRYLPPSSTDVGSDYFVPQSFNFYGLQMSTNMRYEQEYTRALRPFASVSKTWHSRLGAGYGLRLGMAGALLGADHLRLSWGLGKSGLQTEGLTRDLQISYRIHF